MDQQTQSSTFPSSHTWRYIGVLIIGIIIGAGISFAYLKNALTNGQNSYQAGFNAAKQLVENSSIGSMFRTPTDIRAIGGTVTAVNGNQITFHTQSMNPFGSTALNTRTAVVNASTTIVKLTQKDSDVFQAEMNKFMKATYINKNISQTITPPEPFISTPITATNIAVGDNITVTATENIKNMKKFLASKIQIQTMTVSTNK